MNGAEGPLPGSTHKGFFGVAVPNTLSRPLCVFYFSGLSKRSRAHLPGSGPRKDFAAFVEWVLVNNNSPFTICPAEEDFATSPTPLPETNQSPPASDTTEMLFEPTVDCGDRPPARDEPIPRIRTESFIALEPGPLTVSDQVREPATPFVAEGVIVELKGWEESPAHTTTAVDVSLLSSGHYLEELKDLFEAGLIDFFGEVIPNSPLSPAPPVSPESPVSPAPVSPVSLVFPDFLPSLPLPPPRPTSSSAPPSLLSFSPSSSLCQMLTVFIPSAPSHTEGPLSPPQDSVPPAPPRTVDTPVPPWLLPPSAPPDTIGHTASPGSLVFPAPPWSVVHLPAPTAPSGSSFPPAPPTSSVPPAQPLSSGRTSPPRMLIAMAPPRSPVPSAACGLFGSSPTSGSPSLATSPLVVPRVLSAIASTPPRLLPPATPPWGLVMVGLWTNIWLLLLRVSPWLLPPSTPPWTNSLDFVSFCRPCSPPEPQQGKAIFFV
ncbi:hypothetical protein DPX16_19373 [Anabarilius grahami]|uniref:Uncharacterized protein n=1 Tax=Anabarilius grahami TaxID=495550 RepID=A0A3N0Z135_ANAGA|nr:hypothetical protein DPX16_19373 [Anabarilius grahami]